MSERRRRHEVDPVDKAALHQLVCTFVKTYIPQDSNGGMCVAELSKCHFGLSELSCPLIGLNQLDMTDELEENLQKMIPGAHFIIQTHPGIGEPAINLVVPFAQARSQQYGGARYQTRANASGSVERLLIYALLLVLSGGGIYAQYLRGALY